MADLLRILVGALFLSFALLKLDAGLDYAAFLPPWIQVAAGFAEAAIGLALVLTRATAASVAAVVFSVGSLGVFAVHSGIDLPSASRACGCLGSELDLGRSQHMTLISVMLIGSGLAFGFGSPGSSRSESER